MSPRVGLSILVLLAAPVLGACGSGTEPIGKPKAPAPSADAITCPEGGSFDARELEGKSESDAEKLAQEHGCTMRVTERDGKPAAVTMDFREDRINVVVDGGKISRVDGVG